MLGAADKARLSKKLRKEIAKKGAASRWLTKSYAARSYSRAHLLNILTDWLATFDRFVSFLYDLGLKGHFPSNLVVFV